MCGYLRLHCQLYVCEWHKHVAQMKRTKASQSFEASREYNVRRATGISIMTMAPEGEEERHNDDDDDVALDWN